MPFDGIYLGGLGSVFKPQELPAPPPEDARTAAARLSEARHIASEEAGSGNQNRPQGYWAEKVKADNPRIGMTSHAKPAAAQASDSGSSLGLDFDSIHKFAAQKANPR